MLKIPGPSKVRAKAPAETQARARSKKVTDKDLAETREKIIKAANELDMQLEYELEKIRNWRNLTDSYPLEIITGVFSTGYIIGSGILGEVIRIIFFGNSAGSDKNTAKQRKRRYSPSPI
ncbi:MAG: hypothetical protein HY779_01030 [Rubrobacteridae bacterium]|nr:hypothetical protein [Rubrobacteridae bacterium]